MLPRMLLICLLLACLSPELCRIGLAGRLEGREVPARLMITGPPACGKGALCERLAAKYKLTGEGSVLFLSSQHQLAALTK